jgi:thymidylate synthase (FAD)
VTESPVRPDEDVVADELKQQPRWRSDVTVELVKSSASDSDVVWAARVSTVGEQSIDAAAEDPQRSAGLIRYLMKNRHGCYDDQTEVLTYDGWKRWPAVTGNELFMTLAADGSMDYQRAERLVAKPWSGPMLHMKGTQVDLLVTPDHNMLASRRTEADGEQWQLVPAKDFLAAGHRIPIGGGEWTGLDSCLMSQPAMALLGYFIGRGYSAGGRPEFHVSNDSEVAFLTATAAAAGFRLGRAGDNYYVDVDDNFQWLAKKCFDESGSKIIPPDILSYPRESLEALLDGLMNSDGSVSHSGKHSYSTTSLELAGHIQELAVKVGYAAVVADHPFDNDLAHFGSNPLYRVMILREPNLTAEIGSTEESRRREVAVEQYDGMVYCVTVPNGTLYVRRNGKPAWCGNTPFEHNSMTFLISAPIFVFREHHRHRAGWSYNEASARYMQLEPVFYLPGPARKLTQTGKPGHYVFVDGTPEQYETTVAATKRACETAYAAYQEMLAAGIAREVARGVLPVGIYSSMYATCNARSLMAFLSLRTKREDSTFPSYPQREIEMVAEKMEAEWAKLMPITHAAFDAAGRVSP